MSTIVEVAELRQKVEAYENFVQAHLTQIAAELVTIDEGGHLVRDGRVMEAVQLRNEVFGMGSPLSEIKSLAGSLALRKIATLG